MHIIFGYGFRITETDLLLCYFNHDTSTYDNMQHIWTTKTNPTRQFALLFGQMPHIKTDVYLNYHCLCACVTSERGNDNIRNYFVHLQLMAYTVFMHTPTHCQFIIAFCCNFREKFIRVWLEFSYRLSPFGVLDPFLLLKYVISVTLSGFKFDVTFDSLKIRMLFPINFFFSLGTRSISNFDVKTLQFKTRQAF